jgi:hypothetical protein
MKLADALDCDRVVLDLSAGDKVAALKELLKVAGATLELTDTAPLLQRVLDREAICSTAVNWGVAIPHARSPEIDGVVASLGIHRRTRLRQPGRRAGTPHLPGAVLGDRDAGLPQRSGAHRPHLPP